RRSGHGHGEHRPPGDLHPLLDGGWDFLGLAVADSHAAVAVSHHAQGSEGEAPATLDDLRYSVDLDDSLVVLILFSHSKLQSGFAGGVGQRLEAAVVLE